LDNKVFDIIDARCNHEVHLFQKSIYVLRDISHCLLWLFIMPNVDAF